MSVSCWLPESDTDSNTRLENQKCSRFSVPLTNGKSSEMDFRCGGSVINDQTAALRLHQAGGRGWHNLGECHRDSESHVEVRQDPECVASGKFETALGRQPREWCVPIRERRIEGLGNCVGRPEIEGRMEGLNNTF
jgi:hypothetical protein